MNPTDWLRLGVEQYLRDLPDDELDELLQLVRPPDTQGSHKADSAEHDRATTRQFVKLLGGGDD